MWGYAESSACVPARGKHGYGTDRSTLRRREAAFFVVDDWNALIKCGGVFAYILVPAYLDARPAGTSGSLSAV